MHIFCKPATRGRKLYVYRGKARKVRRMEKKKKNIYIYIYIYKIEKHRDFKSN